MKTNHQFVSKEIVVDRLAPDAIASMLELRSLPLSSPGHQSLQYVQMFRQAGAKMPWNWPARPIGIEMTPSTEMWEDLTYLLFELCGLGAIAIAFSV